MTAARLARMSWPELLEELARIDSDPAHQAPPGGLFTLTPAARRKSAAVAEEITERMRARRAAEGSPVPCSGYSGRTSNKR